MQIVSINRAIKFLEKQIAELEKDLTGLSNKEYNRQMVLLNSIKGISDTIPAL